ncbi:hypothetical protein SBBP2_3020005 [Burkholderiales bacterium]|nr:hypothetical protein SBBP2_3020005 [Burkholderiales bacterium]
MRNIGITGSAKNPLGREVAPGVRGMRRATARRYRPYNGRFVKAKLIAIVGHENAAARQRGQWFRNGGKPRRDGRAHHRFRAGRIVPGVRIGPVGNQGPRDRLPGLCRRPVHRALPR